MRAERFDVQGLFGRKDKISIDLRKNAKIIFGINGSGKTTLLKLLNAILTGRLFEIRNINFTSLALRMSNGKTIKATRKKKIRKGRRVPHPGVSYPIQLEFLNTRGKVEHSNNMEDDVELSERVPLHMIEHEIPELSRVGRREWVDATTSDLLTLNDVIMRYSDRLPWLQPSTEIDWYRAIVKEFSVKFIQTQRLMTMKAEGGEYHGRSGVRYQNTVIEYSERLRELIRDKLSDSMSLSQSLDSSYPRRLLQEPGARLDDQELRTLLDETESLSAKFRKVELLSTGDNVDIRLDSIGEGSRQAISLYLSDTVKKYRALEPFVDKLLLFLDIVNTKFHPTKTVEIGGREGIRIGLSSGGEIHPRLLSSGEQHEIVLLCDLIFFSTPGTLVLIDEPEISLHIEWQKKFLSDVEAIGSAADLRFLLATHSPAIIGTRVDICQEI